MTGDFRYNTNWIAITGAPSSGKTSVINELQKRGYATQVEVARELLESAMARGLTIDEIRRNNQDLQRNIIQLKIAREMALDPEALIFLDRGTPDSITYYRNADMDTTEAEAASRLFRYKHVFIFDRLPIKKDGVRTEDEEQANRIDRWLEEDYKRIGYSPIRVPVMPIDERVNFVLKTAT